MSKDIRNLRKEVKDMLKKLRKRNISYNTGDLSYMDVYELQEMLIDIKYVLLGFEAA
jgi:ribosome recycling factor